MFFDARSRFGIALALQHDARESHSEALSELVETLDRLGEDLDSFLEPLSKFLGCLSLSLETLSMFFEDLTSFFEALPPLRAAPRPREVCRARSRHVPRAGSCVAHRTPRTAHYSSSKERVGTRVRYQNDKANEADPPRGLGSTRNDGLAPARSPLLCFGRVKRRIVPAPAAAMPAPSVMPA
jgi:hypothetical protein